MSVHHGEGKAWQSTAAHITAGRKQSRVVTGRSQGKMELPRTQLPMTYFLQQGAIFTAVPLLTVYSNFSSLSGLNHSLDQSPHDLTAFVNRQQLLSPLQM
jgi:hypothetical protein